jgi:hypothetical protein
MTLWDGSKGEGVVLKIECKVVLEGALVLSVLLDFLSDFCASTLSNRGIVQEWGHRLIVAG